jgi:hypothetical protein
VPRPTPAETDENEEDGRGWQVSSA